MQAQVGSKVVMRDGFKSRECLIVEMSDGQFGTQYVIAFEDGSEERRGGHIARDPKLDNNAINTIGIWLTA